MRGRVIAASDCNLLTVEVQGVVRVLDVRLVSERVHSGKGWMHIAVTTDDFLF